MSINIVFTSLPGPESSFVDVENSQGESIRIGEWSEDNRGNGVLTITACDIWNLDNDNGPFNEILQKLMSCLLNERGADQKRITEVGLEWLNTLLSKNQDYGSSAWKTPVLSPECDAGTAIRVRMSDKVERIQSLLKKGTAEVKDEAIDDTFSDLGSYCLLYLARPTDDNEA